MELAAALDAVVALAGQPSEPAVLQRAVDVARDLTGARYAIALLLGPDGSPSTLAHVGMTSAQVAALPHLPRPVGLVGLVLRGTGVRLDDLGAHPESVGFPAGHAPMTAFLGTPIAGDGHVVGGLYLTRPPGEGVFSAADEAAAGALACQVGAVVAGLRAREATEGLLDRLGAPESRAGDALGQDVSSPVVRRLLAAARDVLGTDLTFLSHLRDGQQTFSHLDAGPAAPPLAEGTTIDASGGYCTLLLSGQIPAAVPDVPAHPMLGAMPVTTALGIGSYCGVPVSLPDGTVYGTLCGLGSTPGPAPSAGTLEALTTIAGLIGVALAEQQRHEQRRAAQAAAFAPLLDGRQRAVYLQPIVELRTMTTVGWEALARFTHPHSSPRRPEQVFAEANRLGLGVRLEHAAAAAAFALLPDLPAGAYLSVNLSPQALLSPAVVDLLTAAARDAPGQVVVELTEHDRVADYPALVAVLAGLRERGLRLAVDDTGSGFASLQHVTRLQPDIVKLDIAFVRDVHRDPARRAVARAVSGFAADLGASLVAEGIETADELAELLGLGTTHGQGYHLGRPAPAPRALAAASNTRPGGC